MEQFCGHTTAYLAGVGHELGTMFGSESAMDLDKNAAGRALGRCKKRNCKKACRDALNKGQLVTSPGFPASCGGYTVPEV